MESGNKKISYLNVGKLLSKAIIWEKREFLKEYGIDLKYNEAAERLVFLMIKNRIIPIEIFKEYDYIYSNPELKNPGNFQ